MAISNGTESAKRPHLIFCAMPLEGHTRPVVPIAEAMVEHGFPVTFIGMQTFADRLEQKGIKCVPLPSLLEAMDPVLLAQRFETEPGFDLIAWDLRHIFLGSMHQHWEILSQTMANVHDEDPERPMIILVEYGFVGANVLCHGAPLPGNMTVRPKIVHLGITTYLASSIDTAPWSTHLPPDSSPSGRARNALLDQLLDRAFWAESATIYHNALKIHGATVEPLPRVMDSLYLCQDRVLQMSPPGLNYERSDLPSHVKIIGVPSRMPVDPRTVYPAWWSEVANGNKKIVAVAQGTLAVNYDDLLLPTIRSLADRNDLLVVGILGVRGATLPASAKPLPSNARIVDYLSYDALLPYAAVFVTNGGYGSVLHAVTNGTPMVLAGASEDKPYAAALSAWAGIAVDLRTGRPGEEQVRDAVNKVLTLEDGNGEKEGYKARAMRMMRENEAMDPLGEVERCVLELAGSG